MTVTGIGMFKDEADIVRQTVTQMLCQVDRVIVADNGSTDGTRDLLTDLERTYSGRVILVDDDEVAYLQSAKMTALAHQAREAGADWVVPFDADEFWYCPVADTIADLLDKLAPQWLCAAATVYDHVATNIDADDRDPYRRLGWRRRTPVPLPKVACRALPDLVIEQGNHSASYPGGATVYPDHLVVRHFPYRSVDQMVTKVRNGAAAYAASALPESMGKHWRDYGRLLDHGGRDAIAEVFHDWFYSDDPDTDPSLIYDPVTSLQ